MINTFVPKRKDEKEKRKEKEKHYYIVYTLY